jgi:hypothetical protein
MILRNPRRGTLSIIIGFVLVVLILLHRSRFLIGLLFEDGGIDSIFYDDIPSENTTLPLLVPKIIHQTYKDHNLPEHWKNAQDAVKYYHPDYEYKVRLSCHDTTSKQGTDTANSSGQMRAVSSSSKPITRQWSLPTYRIRTPSSAWTHCGICSFITMAAFTSISTSSLTSP